MGKQKISLSEQTELTALLSRLEAGFLPFDIFVQIARLVVLSIIEFVPIRVYEGQLQVLLIGRDEDDTIWPGSIHVPGAVIRPTDKQEKLNIVFDRIIKEELKGTKVSEPVYVKNMFHESRRGMEQAQIFIVEVLAEPLVGKFYDIDHLPDNLMDSQVEFIMDAAKYYREKII